MGNCFAYRVRPSRGVSVMVSSSNLYIGVFQIGFSRASIFFWTVVKLFKKRVIFMSAYQMISYILYRSSCRFTNILATCFAVFYCYLYHNVFVFYG